MQKSSAVLVEALHNPHCYDHPVDRVKLVETHISWVFLAGEYAYKLKKPVNFGFLDFSTLNKRQHFCQEELRLNRRFAPRIYLDVVSLGGSAAAPVIGGTPTLDYLVKMKRFSRQEELDQLLQNGLLEPAQIEKFAEYLAELHKSAPRIEQNRHFGSPDAVKAPVEENFLQIRKLLHEKSQRRKLDRLESYSRQTFQQHLGLLQKRKKEHFIRECHGDIHLANMLWHNGEPLLFDCIEFNEDFRCIDIVNDYAFLLMDLDDRGADRLSWHFLNRYLQKTGDYQGLHLLDYYRSYRAMVRAKVVCLRLAQVGRGEKVRENDEALLHSYLELAERYTQQRRTPLIITHGFSGSGKSTFIRQLAPRYGAIGIHSDIERKRLHGLEEADKSDSTLAAGIYSEHASEKTYHRLLALAETAIKAGFPTILDATFLKQQQRKQARRLAERLKVPFIILDFTVNEKELFLRVAERSINTGKISEATPEVLQMQLQQTEPLAADEKLASLKIFPDTPEEDIVIRIKHS
ncbi:bifunctional aminoglycoside phosphotransferase/ATP-binding protein [Malonomonas rubra]|uniref:bifunctional aminoglycoside phosphotransferase/ATP-binding protein n=1 Tax=Malonomonas rubra TaxID=57040 RepID=UPI0026EE3717|nr:bifunctional aminoglycoside phosphotransferase/ATP-binding protein [Malonomonas rubra]